MSIFRIGGKLSPTTSLILGVVGLLIFILVWWLLAEAFSVKVSSDNEDVIIDDTVVENDSDSDLLELVDVDPREDIISENALEGTLLPLKVKVQTADTSQQIYYSLLDDKQSGIRIHPVNGQFEVMDGSLLDYEKTTNIALTALAKSEGGLIAKHTFNIQLSDVNEFSLGEITDVDALANEVPKSAKLGMPVGITAFAEDGDGSDQVNYELITNPSNVFGINAGSGEIYVKDESALSRQAEGELNLKVLAKSEDGSSRQTDFRLKILPAKAVGGGGTASIDKVYPILPTPLLVVKSFPSLIEEDELIPNTIKSIWLNFKGYFWAILISIPIGFLIGLFPIFRGMFSKQVDALRYLPLTALTGLFIIWFGIEDEMKVSFLAFGIIVYLLPVVVQRIDEINDVYKKTVFTLGANSWQTIKSVYLPSVLSKLIDDIRVLTAISWTYIIIAELLNRQGGIGALIYIKARQGQIEKVFATLIVIILIGFIQDRIFVYLDRRLFPHKFFKTTLGGIREVEYGIYTLLAMFTLLIFQQLWFPSLDGLFGNLAVIVMISALVIIVYGEMKVRRSVSKSA